ncbi:hypothetical protein [Glutamicibacter ardleyensis]|uniref:hypothetical protein n=1 Tax=Glutamicibacter ardleyensis TaxID=225894 RepID=UPI003FD1A01B
MPNTPLNPDALETAARATYEMRNPESWAHSWEELDPEEREEEWVKPARTVATAYLAVAQPVVNSVEELDALPVGSVFMDSDKDWAYQIISNGEPGREGRVIVGAGLEEDFGADELVFPLTVLRRPEVPGA